MRFAFWKHRDREQDLDDEIRSHLAMSARDRIRQGASEDDAASGARREFGNIGQVKEVTREQQGLPVMETVSRDLRIAMRGLAKEPGFTSLCILTLALAIGANTAIFSVVNAVLLRPLPYSEANQLVQVWETNPQANRWGDWASYPDYLDWRRENRTFEGMAAFRYGRFRLTSGPYPEMLTGVRVSPELFSVLRVNPMLGRSFLAEEGTQGRNDVAILSYGVWQRQFGSDPALAGKMIPLDGRSFQVVGVMPPGFTFPANLDGAGRVPDVWIPVAGDADRGSHNYRVIARLKPHQTIQDARTDSDRLAEFVAGLDPGHRGRGMMVAGLQQHTVAAVRPALLVLVGAIALVLLIACANVASLLLARGAARQKEVALRLALGAGPKRVLQQGLTESVLLALMGSGAGLLVAYVGVRFLIAIGPALPLVKGATLDARVLVFTLATALATGIAFGVAPTWQALKVQANEALKEVGPRHAGSVGRSRIRTALTVAQIALALMLLIGAGLLIRSFAQLRGVEVGFEVKNLLTAFVTAPPEVSADPEQTAAFFQEVLARVERLPGVQAAAAASAIPLLSNETSPFRVEGAETPQAGQAIVYAEQPKITPTYFRAMGIRLVRGRPFTTGDIRGSPPVAVVSEGLAKTSWPGEDAIGKRVMIDDREWRSVVGVVQDVRHDGMELPARPTVYIPFAQYPRSSGVAILVRGASDPTPLVGELRRAVMDVNKNQPLFGIQTMEQALSQSVSLKRFLMILVAMFAGAALVLGTVGVYGVLAYFVGQRRQEIGIRMALGTDRHGVVRFIVMEGARLALTGVGIGVLGSLVLSRVLSGMLFGVEATDPWTFLVVPVLLFSVVLAASYLPARAAASLEPMIALRNQ